MKLDVYRLGSFDSLEKVDFEDAIFTSKVRPDIVKRVIDWQLAGRMRGTHLARNVSQISGTTKKPFKQKGTGRARQGSSRSAQMRGGAQCHGPVVRSHAVKLPKKVRVKGLCSAISDRFSAKKMVVVDSLDIKSFKTKELKKLLLPYTAKSFFIVGDEVIGDKFKNAVSNLRNISVVPSQAINVYDIVKHEFLIITKSAIVNLGKRLLNV